MVSTPPIATLKAGPLEIQVKQSPHDQAWLVEIEWDGGYNEQGQAPLRVRLEEYLIYANPGGPSELDRQEWAESPKTTFVLPEDYEEPT